MYSRHFSACRWLLELVYDKEMITRREIDELWMKEKNLSDGLAMDPRNLQRYKKTLKESFGIDICCKQGGDYAYFIKNPEILQNNHLPIWLLNILAINEKMKRCLSLMNRIRLEYIPSGGEKLETVIDAMLGNQKMAFRYQKYGNVEWRDFIVGLCGLVLYRRRWYIIGELENQKKYTFSIDRMISSSLTNMEYVVDPSFSIDDYFCEIYGIYNSGRALERIVLRAFGEEAYHMRDLPIHQSQQDIGSGDGYSDFMIKVRPNKELMSYIISRSNCLKILSPEPIVEEFKEIIASIMKNYQSVMIL